MSELYNGTKFKTIFLKKREIDDSRINELIHYCKEFAKKGLCPKYEGGSCGNMSIMTNNGLIITGANTDLETISIKDLVLVQDVDYDKKEVKVIGLKEPSSETLLHLKIYELRHQINAVFHGHSKLKGKYSETEEEKPYGSMELVKEVEKILADNMVVIMKNHGFLSLGKDMKEAGNISLS